MNNNETTSLIVVIIVSWIWFSCNGGASEAEIIFLKSFLGPKDP